MSFHVTIKPSNRELDVEAGETVLEAALRSGITLAYGCRNGACGSCKGKVLQGQVDYGDHAAHVLPDFEKKLGFALFCHAKPLTDLVIEAREINAAGAEPDKKLPCRVQRIERPADDVAVLLLSLPANERLQFLAGQYVEIILRDGKRRAYSLANAPEDDAHIELHVRNMAGGTFTDYVFNKMKEKDILRFEGPLGTFFLREDSDKPIDLPGQRHRLCADQEHPAARLPQRREAPDGAVLGRAPAQGHLHGCAVPAVAGGARQLQLHPGGLRCAARRSVGGPYRLRPSRRDAGLPRPVGLSGLCLRRADRRRVGARRLHVAVQAARRGVLLGRVHPAPASAV